MKSLSDLIKEKSEDMSVQITKAIPMDEEDVEWVKCRQTVKGLSLDYEEVIKKAINENRARTRQVIKGNAIEVTAKYNGFEVDLHILEGDDRIIKQAKYIAWNHRKGTCFIRDLFKEDPLNL